MELKKYTQSELNEIIRLNQLWLEDNPKGKRANLSYSNLSHLDLSHINLSYANLSHADLSHANLSHANLSHADLYKANLSHANLSHADLSHDDLYKANLSHANLSYANLYKSSLFYANLDGIITNDIIKVYYNYDYNIQIKTKEWIKVGCQEHSLKQWLNFNESEIFEMDGLEAINFYPTLVDLLKQTFKVRD